MSALLREARANVVAMRELHVRIRHYALATTSSGQPSSAFAAIQFVNSSVGATPG